MNVNSAPVPGLDNKIAFLREDNLLSSELESLLLHDRYLRFIIPRTALLNLNKP